MARIDSRRNLAAVLAALVFALAATSFAGDAYDLARPAFRTYTDKDGLPDNTILSIALDQKGFLWVGTQAGPAVYNGRVWTTVSLPGEAMGSLVRDIVAGSSGSLFFSTGAGVVERKPGGEMAFLGPEQGFGKDSVRDLLEVPGEDPALWLATFSHGVARYQKGAWTLWSEADGLPSTRVGRLLRDHAGTMWAGTEDGLARFDGTRWQRAGAGTGASRAIRSLLETIEPDGSSTLWIGTLGGLVRRRGEEWIELGAAQGMPSAQAMTLYETVNHRGESVVWAGFYGSGLARLEGGKWQVWDAARGSFPGSLVRSMAETRAADGSRILWVGTQGEGLVRIIDRRFRALDPTTGLPRGIAASFAETPGRYWVGTSEGLARIDGERLQLLSRQDGIPEGMITGLSAVVEGDQRTGLWVGTYGGGVLRVDPDSMQIERWEQADGLPTNVVSCLRAIATEDGFEVWMGSFNSGLAVYRDRHWTTIGPAQGAPISANDLLDVQRDDGSRVLFVSHRDGLSRLEGGVWIPEPADLGFPSSTPLCLREVRDAAGRRWLWLGTRGSGAARRPLAGGSWQIFDAHSEPALPNDVVYGIEQDAAGRVYFLTGRGVARFEEKRAGFVASTFNVEDGLPNNQGYYHSSMRDGQGRIWFGTVAGAAIFDPAFEIPDRIAKPLVIETAFTLRDRAPLVDGARLPHDSQDLEFDFALLSFQREGETRFRTELRGFHAPPSDWVPEAKKEYGNLPSGDYVFRVWGRDYAGNVSGPRELPFSIAPAPWRTWWAYAGYLLGLLAGGWAVMRIRLATLRRRNELLEAKVRERTFALVDTVEKLRDSEAKAHEAREEAVRANRAKGVFLAAMSHELRTPLNAILGYAQLMQRKVGRDDDDRQHLGIVARSGEHLLGLIDQVLSLTKIESGRLELAIAPFDLARMVDEVGSLFALKAEAKGLKMTSTLEPDVPRFVVGDGGKLRQILINLLGNALKFTAAGEIRLHVSREGERVRFVVEDTGVGIDPDDSAKLFVPFSQAEAGRVSGEGTGLGLVISQSFVRLMGGEIDVTSRLGSGSRFEFSISLPEADRAPITDSHQRVIALSPGQKTYKALVVDDREENRRLLAGQLAAVGFAVSEAADGEEAVTRWQEVEPDLVIMDSKMPRMTGEEATRAIRRLEDGRRTVIIAASASAFDGDREALLAAGCDAFLARPIHENLLFQTIAEKLGVRFVTAESETPVAMGDLSMRLGELPAEARRELARALAAGDVRAAEAALAAVEEGALKAWTLGQIRAYELDRLQAALERAEGS